jgi:hypothetical protein
VFHANRQADRQGKVNNRVPKFFEGAQNAIIFVKSIEKRVFLIDKKSACCEAESENLYTI